MYQVTQLWSTTMILCNRNETEKLFNTFENTEIELYTLFSKFSIHNFTYLYQKNGIRNKW